MSKGAKIATIVVIVVLVGLGLSMFMGGSSEGIYQANVSETINVLEGEIVEAAEEGTTIVEIATDEVGNITSLVIDTIKDGASKQELGDDYGLAAVSEVGNEWYVQANLLADAIIESQGVTELIDGLVDNGEGKLITEAISGVTIGIETYLNDVQVVLDSLLA